MVDLAKGCAVLGGLVVLACAAPALAEPDVLERPALISARAQNSVIMAVTTAGKRLVAVGERGIVLTSDDNGDSWKQSAVPVSVALTNARFVTEKTGWAIGHSGVVLKSEDGGLSWVKQLDGTKAAAIVLETANAFAAAHPDDMKSRRLLGEADQKVAEGADKPFLDLYFKNEREGFIVGAYGLFLATGDGGQSWQGRQDRLDNRKGLHLYAIDVAGDDILISGEQGTLYHSADGGAAFEAVKLPYDGTYFGVRHIKDGVLAFGLRGNAYRSADGLKSWSKVETNDPETLTASVTLADGSLLLVDLTGNLLLSGDQGHSFRMGPRQAMPLTGVVEAGNGAVVVSGLGGITRLARQSIDQGSVK